MVHLLTFINIYLYNYLNYQIFYISVSILLVVILNEKDYNYYSLENSFYYVESMYFYYYYSIFYLFTFYI